MAKSSTQRKCFIIMPITTPPNFVAMYKDDPDHFTHVLDHLFIPALKEAGFEPIPPKAEGSNIIHADIIKRLSESELVLCDMSILDPNVFFEFGIRTALDKPVALVVDDKTKPIPFDTGIINFHQYESSLAAWTLEEQKKKMTEHVQNAYKKSKDNNTLWKYFGVAQTGTFKPEQAEVGEKMDFLMNKTSAIETQLKTHQAILELYTEPNVATWGLPRPYTPIVNVPARSISTMDAEAKLSVVYRAMEEARRKLEMKEVEIKELLKREKEKPQQQQNNQNGKSEATSE